MKIEIEVDAAELWSAVMGSGFQVFPWWEFVDYLEGDWETPGRVRLVTIDPDTGAYDSEAEVTVEDIAKAFANHVQYGLDIDAEVGDAILQEVVYGEAVFG